MKIYFAHYRNFEYENEYYKPIEDNKQLQKETLIFPHKNNDKNYNKMKFYTNLDIFIT